MTESTLCSAFSGTRLIASGKLLDVALAAKTAWDREKWSTILIFDDLTSDIIDVDYSGTPEEVLQHLTARLDPAPENLPPSDDPRKPGRPRLGVIAREVTLLPRHWDWLATQPGGASIALRKLVEQARIANSGSDQRRRAQESAYRFLSAMAGNESGFEEATRALFAAHLNRFNKIVEPWPPDVRDHARRLASAAITHTEAAS